jgi:hypothetical protein
LPHSEFRGDADKNPQNRHDWGFIGAAVG